MTLINDTCDGCGSRFDPMGDPVLTKHPEIGPYAVFCWRCEETDHTPSPGQCRYMQAAYPTLDASDTCDEHQHNDDLFALATALAVTFQGTTEPSDEQIGWFLNDAQAVIEEFDPVPDQWSISELHFSDEAGLEQTFHVNDVEFVFQENDSGGHVENTPVARSTWDQWMREANGDEEDDDE